ncbi:hypothetical protein, partial [Pseudomonas amygdali]|uniref:hypothetical protein n=1 Tax=Pseudomonas amygdali TaxID=47877 RepID=UPI001E2AF4E4
ERHDRHSHAEREERYVPGATGAPGGKNADYRERAMRRTALQRKPFDAHQCKAGKIMRRTPL